MQITTVMVVHLLDLVHADTAHARSGQIPPAPTPVESGIQRRSAWAGLPGTRLADRFRWSRSSLPLDIRCCAMSGFETLAQVYREIATPKLKNLKITGKHRLRLSPWSRPA